MSADVFDDFENDVFKTTKEQIKEAFDEAEEQEREKQAAELHLTSLKQKCHDTLPSTIALLNDAFNKDNAGLFAYYLEQYVILDYFIKEEEKIKLHLLEKFFNLPSQIEENEWEEYLPEIFTMARSVIHIDDNRLLTTIEHLKRYTVQDLAGSVLVKLRNHQPIPRLSEFR